MLTPKMELLVSKKTRIKDCFKINSKQRIINAEKGEYIKFRNCERKLKSSCIIYAYF